MHTHLKREPSLNKAYGNKVPDVLAIKISKLPVPTRKVYFTSNCNLSRLL
jgi:hypothetical protein